MLRGSEHSEIEVVAPEEEEESHEVTDWETHFGVFLIRNFINNASRFRVVICV
jgi:hypothetical protein